MAPNPWMPPSVAFNPKTYKKKPRKPKTPKNPYGPPSPDDFLADLDTSAEEEADRIVDEMLAELGYARDSARREAERSAQSEIARAQALASALQSLNMPGVIQGVYQNSGQSLAGLAQGFSESTRGLANQHAAEQTNMVAGTGQEGAVRNEGAAMGDVQYGLYGFIPGRTLEETGAAFAANAALQPGFALRFGQEAASQAMNDWVQNELPKFTDDEAMIRSKKTGLKLDARERMEAAEEKRQARLKEAKDAKTDEAYDLYEAGLITQRELGRRLGVPGWKKMPAVRKGEESQAGIELRTIGGDLVAVNMATGKVQVLYQGAEDANLKTIQLSDGSDVVIDMTTGKPVRTIGGPTKKPPVRTGGPTTGYDLWDPYTNEYLGHIPATSTTGKKGNGPLWKQHGFKSAADMNSTGNVLARETQGTKDKTDKYGNVTSEGKPKMGPKEAFDHLVKNNIPPAIARKILSKYYNPAKLPKVSAGGRHNASYQGGGSKQDWLASLWIQAGGDPKVAYTAAAIAMAESGGRVDAWNPNGQDKSAGLWQINYHGSLREPRTRQFGPPELLRRDPLANARAAVAIYKGAGNSFNPWTTYTSGKYKPHVVSPGGNRASSGNVSFQPGGGWGGSHDIATNLSQITQQHGLKIWSEKRDTKATASGGVSDHWVGSKTAYAYDMSGSVPQMDKAAMDLLRSLGYQWDGRSSVVKNFYKNGYRIQVLYRTNVGGNHYNHIHIGVRKEGESA